MKISIDFKKQVLPHLIAIAIFIGISSMYNIYEFQGKKLQSHDGISYQGAAKELLDYKEQGDKVLWNSRVFSGMPLFQMAYKVEQNLIKSLGNYIRIFPLIVGLVFSLMIGFYIALMFFEVDWKVAIVSSIGFGLATWLLLSIEASHNTKILTISYVAPLIGALYHAYKKNLFVGAVFVAFFVSISVASNHYQITYYSMFFIFFIILFQFVKAVKDKKIGSFFKKSAIIFIFTLFGVMPNATRLWITYEYATETMRGGKSELSQLEEKSETGLDKDYAMRWSYGKAETFNLLIPGLYASGHKLGVNSNLVKELTKKGVSKKQALTYAQNVPMYYGTQPFTSGPNYIGVIFFLLFGMLFFIEESKVKWALLSTVIVTIFFAWGSNFWAWNSLFFNNLPMFNKFRAPSMWLSMTTIAIGIGAALSLNKIYKKEVENDKLEKSLKIVSGTLAAVLLVFVVMGSGFFEFAGSNDSQLAKNGFPVDALVKDRIALLKSDSIRALVLLLLVSALIWTYIKGKLSNSKYFILGIGLVILFDMWSIGKRYFNEDDFTKVRKNIETIVATKADKQIEKDQSYFRVFNTTVSSFNDNSTSYRHHSVGGYSAAKLYRYQDIIDKFLSKGNMQIFNMLNTKYFVQGDPGKEVANTNPGALGAAWFVDSLVLAKDADQEVKIMETFNAKTTVVVDERFKNYVSDYKFGNTNQNQISLESFHPDKMIYKTNASSNSFAVFSEIWYRGNIDWKVYVDGEEDEFARVNYLLRGMKIPKGEHEIIFEFKPKTHYIGKNISLFFSLLLIGLIVFIVFRALKTNHHTQVEV